MLRNMGIKPRAVISFGTLAFIVLMLGILALVALSSMRDSARKVDQEMLPAIMSIGDISQDFHRLRAATLRVMLSRTKSDIQRDKLLVDELKSGIEIEERKYQALISASPEAKRLYGRFDSAQKVYIDVQARVIGSAEQGQLDQAIELVNSELNPAGKSVADALSDLMQATQQQASEAAKQAKSVYEKTQIFIAISILVALVVTSILASAFSQSIVQPLRKAVQAARSIAEQDLTQSISVDGQDEPGQLLDSLKLMQSNLQKAMQQISTSSSQVASAAEELSVSSQTATHNLSQQGHEVEQAATAVNEMTAAVESVAVNAVETSDASKEADTLAHTGQQRVQAAIQSLNGLNDDVAHTVSNVELLASRVQEITKVLDVIQTIAEQTNLLALNAAIEAARAGDAGRGFAVVADEVRGLAHRTQQSTQEIEQMIKDIQQGTAQAVSAMQGSQAKAVNTLSVAEQAGEVLAQIAVAISRINERNLLIASASEEQAQVSREVDRNLVRIRDWSMQTSAGANQSHAASQELANLAVQLNQVVTRFRL